MIDFIYSAGRMGAATSAYTSYEVDHHGDNTNDTYLAIVASGSGPDSGAIDFFYQTTTATGGNDYYGTSEFSDPITGTFPTTTTSSDSQTIFTITQTSITIPDINYDDYTGVEFTSYGIYQFSQENGQNGPVTQECHSVVLQNNEIGFIGTKSLNFFNDFKSFSDSTTYNKFHSYNIVSRQQIEEIGDPAVIYTATRPSFFQVQYELEESTILTNQYTNTFSSANYLGWPAFTTSGSSSQSYIYQAVYIYVDNFKSTTYTEAAYATSTDIGWEPVTFTIPTYYGNWSENLYGSVTNNTKTAYFSTVEIAVPANYIGTNSLYHAVADQAIQVNSQTISFAGNQSYIEGITGRNIFPPTAGFPFNTVQDAGFALFAPAWKNPGLVSPNGGFATRQPNLSFTGSIEGVPLTGYYGHFPYASAQKGVLTPFPYSNSSFQYNGYITYAWSQSDGTYSNDTSVSVDWFDSIFHYTTAHTASGTNSFLTGTGTLSYEPEGNIATSVGIIGNANNEVVFNRSFDTATAYIPYPGAVIAHIGSDSSVSSFTCATTTTYAYSHGCVLSYSPATLGTAIVTFDRYVSA
jgi:hypothetical protein